MADVCLTPQAAITPVYQPKPGGNDKVFIPVPPIFNWKPIPAPPGNIINNTINNIGGAVQNIIQGLNQVIQGNNITNNTINNLATASFVEDRSQRITEVLVLTAPDESASWVIEQINQVIWVNGLGQTITWQR